MLFQNSDKFYVSYHSLNLGKDSYSLTKFEWGNMPQKSVFDTNNEIIPNQTILREKNQ